MPNKVRVCRVCGKEYTACRTPRLGEDAFNWREVACSPECGMKYFQMVEEARRGKKSAHKKAKRAEEPKETHIAVEPMTPTDMIVLGEDAQGEETPEDPEV